MGALKVILQGFATLRKNSFDKLKNSLFRVGKNHVKLQ